MLMKQSPFYSSKDIKAPLLLAPEMNDPAIKKVQSDKIVTILRDFGRNVEYICAPDEGHGFYGAENGIALSVARERFFGKHLGAVFRRRCPTPY